MRGEECERKNALFTSVLIAFGAQVGTIIYRWLSGSSEPGVLGGYWGCLTGFVVTWALAYWGLLAFYARRQKRP